MPLYNCFSNTLCPRLDISFDVVEDVIDSTTNKATKKGYVAKFDTRETNYKIYMIPIKLFQKYTIAIDCFTDVEVCCGFYGKYQYGSAYDAIAEDTYRCFNSMLFNKPVLYDPTAGLTKYLDPRHPLEIAQHETDLKLFIKLPISNKSSIVILEGDYTEYTPSTIIKHSPTKDDDFIVVNNRTQVNFDGDLDENIKHLVTPLQLLAQNTGISYPFADRLIEYLVGNAVTPVDDISDNIKRAKKVINAKTNALRDDGGI